jgi:hypothetical protein
MEQHDVYTFCHTKNKDSSEIAMRPPLPPSPSLCNIVYYSCSWSTRFICYVLGVAVISWKDWERTDSVERTRSEKVGKPCEKIVDIQEMLAVSVGTGGT